VGQEEQHQCGHEGQSTQQARGMGAHPYRRKKRNRLTLPRLVDDRFIAERQRRPVVLEVVLHARAHHQRGEARPQQQQ
jgi:hypothetical protein